MCRKKQDTHTHTHAGLAAQKSVLVFKIDFSACSFFFASNEKERQMMKGVSHPHLETMQIVMVMIKTSFHLNHLSQTKQNLTDIETIPRSTVFENSHFCRYESIT